MLDIEKKLDVISENFKKLKILSPVILEIAQICITAVRNGNKIIFCGNGGSAADAQHLAAELVGKYNKTRPAIASISLTTDTSILTAVSNDVGYDSVFARQVEALGKCGDVLIAISTSGNSNNITSAIEKARENGITTIAFTGKNGGKIKDISDIILNVPSNVTNNIQEMHIAVGHIICEIIENELFTDYKTVEKEQLFSVGMS